MARPLFEDIATSTVFQELPPEQKRAATERYWNEVAAENPQAADYAAGQRENANAYLDASEAEVDAAPVQKRELALRRRDAAFQLALGERAFNGSLNREDVARLAAEHTTRTQADRLKIEKTRSLADPEVQKQMAPAFEALGTHALRGGVFGSPSLDARVSDILPGGEKDAVKTSKETYGKLRDQMAGDFNLSSEEVDDLVKHQLDLQPEMVSRDAMGTPYVKNEVLAQGVEATTKAINESNLPWSIKQRMVEGLPERMDAFKKSVVDDVFENSPELAEKLRLGFQVADPTQTETRGNSPAGYRPKTVDEQFAEITGALNQGAGSQGLGGFAAGGLGTLEFFPGELGEEARVGRQETEQLNALSSRINQSKTQLFGTDAAAFGQGGYSVAEAIGMSYLTGGAAAPIAAERIASLGKFGKILANGFNASAKVAPVAGLAATKTGVQTYDSALAAGKTPEEAAKLAGTSAAIEFGVTTLFSALPGLGGVEDVGAALRSQGAKDALKSGWKTFTGKTALGITGEQAEENLIAALDAVSVQAQINPDMTVDDLKRALADTMKVTFAVSGPASALGAWAETRQKPTYEQSTEELEISADQSIAEAAQSGAADPLAAGTPGEESPAPVPAGDLAADGTPPDLAGVGDSGLRDAGAGGAGIETAGSTELAPETDGPGDAAGVGEVDPADAESVQGEAAAPRVIEENNLPEIPEGYVAVLHKSPEESVESIWKNGLRYRTNLSSTAHSITSWDQLEQVGGLNGKWAAALNGDEPISVFLVPDDEHNAHQGRRGAVPPGTLSPERLLGVIPKRNTETTNDSERTAAPPTREQVARTRVRTAKEEIAADIASGEIPDSVKSFADLQDHVDANLYVNDADREDNLIGELGRRENWKPEDYAGFTNEVISELDAWLAAGRPDTETTTPESNGTIPTTGTADDNTSGDSGQAEVSTIPEPQQPVPTNERQEGQRQGRQEVLTPEDDIRSSDVVPPTPPKSEDSTTGIRNAKVDASRKRRGLPERFAPAKQTFQGHWDAALAKADADPQAGTKLVSAVRARPRALTGDENALFTHEQLTREQAVDEALDAINSAKDDDARAVATARFNEAQTSLQEIYDVGQATGTLASQSLNTRRILVQQDFSLARMLAREQAVVNEGKPLSNAQIKEVEALHQRIKELEEKTFDLQDRLVASEAEKTFRNQAREAKKAAKGATPRGEKAPSFIDKQAAEARKRIAARRGQLNTGLVGLAAQEVFDYSVIGVSYIANGATKLADFTARLVEEFGEKLRQHAPTIFAKSQELSREAAEAPSRAKTAEEITEGVEAGSDITGKLVYDLARAYINAGVDGFENVMGAVLADLQKTHPDLTLREVHDAYSGYGKVRFPSKEEDRVKLNEYRNLARLTSQLEDALQGKPPQRTGQQRDPATERVRTLQREVKETMRRLNIKVPSRATALRTSLDAAKTRLRNELEELQTAIDNKTPRQTGRTPLELDEEAKALKEQLKTKRAEYAKIFDTKGLTDSQRVRAAIGATSREIENVENELAKGIAEKRERADRSPWSPELGELKARLNDLRDFRDRLRRARSNTPDAILKRTTERLEKSVARMRKIVESGKLPMKKGKRPFTPTDEVKALLKEEAALKDLVNALRRDGVTEDQKYERAKAAALRNLPKQIAAIEEKLRTGNFSTRQNKASVWTPEIGKMRTELAAQREALKFVKAITTPKRSPEEIRLSREKAAIRARIQKLQDRIKNNDYGPKVKPDPVMDAEKAALQLQEIKAKKEFNERLFEAELAKRSTARKVFDTTTDVLAVPRSIMTSFDFGAVFRQGGWAALGNPQILVKAFPSNFKALTEVGAQRYQNQIEANPNYALAKKAGLYIAEIGEGHTLNDVEEVYRSRLARKIPVLGKGIKASERVYSTYLNLVRMGLFDSMVKTLTKDGKTISPENAKVIANYVNIATGRGNLGKSENAASALANVFFSPKYVASRFQLLYGAALTAGDVLTGFTLGSRQTVAARKAIAREYAKTLIGIGILYSAAAAFAGDEEDDKWTISGNPGSADFGKLKVGNTRIDFMAGLLQSTVFLNRVLTGTRTNAKGETVSMRGDDAKFGESVVGTIGKFLRTKLAPLPSTALNLLDGQDVTGNPATPETEAIGFLLPLSAGDIYSAIEEQGVPKGTALGLMSLFGIGAQTYGGAETSMEGDIATWLGGDPDRYQKAVKENKPIPIGR